jgi:hypothetical protein
MSKRTRNTDNSKRQQPVQQQRAHARQPAGGNPSKNGSGSGESAQRQGESGSDTKR